MPNTPKPINSLAALRNRVRSNQSNTKTRLLSEAEKRRFDKLTGLLAKLKAGKHVQNRDLETWLTATEYQSLLEAWEEQKDVREEILDKPAEIKKYEELVRAADFEFHKSNFYKADAKYELALEHLQEITGCNQNLRLWFDRECDCKVEGEINLSPSGVPRVVTSRSQHVANNGLWREKLKKIDVKIACVEMALANLAYEQEPIEPASSSNVLKNLLQLPEDEF